MALYLALDIETTGLDPMNHGILEIAVQTDKWNRLLLCDPRPCEVDEKAMEINGINLDNCKSLCTIEELDDRLDALLNGMDQIVPVGFNVGSFDMAFIRHYLPLSARKFSHRSFDLNSMLMYVASATNVPFNVIKEDLIHGFRKDRKQHRAVVDCDIAWKIFRSFVAATEVEM